MSQTLKKITDEQPIFPFIFVNNVAIEASLACNESWDVVVAVVGDDDGVARVGDEWGSDDGVVRTAEPVADITTP